MNGDYAVCKDASAGRVSNKGHTKVTPKRGSWKARDRLQTSVSEKWRDLPMANQCQRTDQGNSPNCRARITACGRRRTPSLS